MAETAKDKRAEVQNVTKSGKWYILARKRDNYIIQMQCQRTVYHPATGERLADDKQKHRDIEFQHGLYWTEDREEIDFLNSHYLSSEAAPPATSFRPCTEEEVSWIEKLRERGIARKLWHDRLKALENAMSQGGIGR